MEAAHSEHAAISLGNHVQYGAVVKALDRYAVTMDAVVMTSRMGVTAEGPHRAALEIVIAVACSVFWMYVQSRGHAGTLVSGIMAILVGAATLLLVTRRTAGALAVIAYLAILEPFFKKHAVLLPYMTLQYMSIMWALLVVFSFRRLPKLRWPLTLYGAYFLLEVGGLIGANGLAYARAVLLPSLALLLFITIGNQIRLSDSDLKTVASGFFLGGVSLGAIVAYAFVSGQITDIVWTTESNFATSGGIGPVQVSFVLSVVVFLAFCISGDKGFLVKYVYRVISVVLIFFMIMTFSRGGLYLLGGATLVHLVIRRRFDIKIAAALLAGSLVLMYVFELGATMTEGAIVERYRDASSSNRTLLAEYGWEMFLDHSIIGVGTGAYYEEVERFFGMESGAHNELIRSAAEHGILGLMSWLLFAAAGAWAAAKPKRRAIAAFRVALFALFIASTFHNGLKLLVQPLLVLLAFSYQGPPLLLRRKNSSMTPGGAFQDG